ncbi:hypothetical protein ILUMI_17967, partial [Ignelater luminosus]
FKRLEFPIRLAFAMTINKSQGQSLKVCGLNLENPCFSHGELYVACSRVGRPSALFVLAPDNKTKNVVYHKISEVYRESTTSDEIVIKWVRAFKDGGTNIHDDVRSERPPGITEDLVQKVDAKATDFYEDGIKKLAVCSDKCLNNGGNDVEK